MLADLALHGIVVLSDPLRLEAHNNFIACMTLHRQGTSIFIVRGRYLGPQLFKYHDDGAEPTVVIYTRAVVRLQRMYRAREARRIELYANPRWLRRREERGTR